MREVIEPDGRHLLRMGLGVGPHRSREQEVVNQLVDTGTGRFGRIDGVVGQHLLGMLGERLDVRNIQVAGEE